MVRDLRDPKLLGTYLLNNITLQRIDEPKATASEVADRFRATLDATPAYDGSNDIRTVTPAGAKH